MSTALSLLTRQAEKTPKVTSLSPRGLWHRIEEHRPTSITLKTRPSMFLKGSLRSSAPMNLSAPNPEPLSYYRKACLIGFKMFLRSPDGCYACNLPVELSNFLST